MDTFVIEGGRRLSGRVRVYGSKNAALPLTAAALLTDQPVTLRDVPDLADLKNMYRLLAELGCVRTSEPPAAPAGVINLHTQSTANSHARYDIVKTMRASICTLGPLVAKRGFARVSMPGGCSIGDRPVDLHLRGLAALGAEITLTAGDISAKAPQGGLKGATIFLGGASGPTVLGTANVMSAATLARGTTVIESADTPGHGYVVVHIPQSVRAPHMADGRYYGRGDKTNRVLPNTEVVRLLDQRLADRRDLRAEAQHVGHGQRALVQALGERRALDQLHHEVVRLALAAHVEQRADVRVVERRHDFRFALEARAHVRIRAQVLGQHLDRHLAAESRVARAVDLTHSSRAQRGEDLVRTELRSGSERHAARTSEESGVAS